MYEPLYQMLETDDWTLARVQHPTHQTRFTWKRLKPQGPNPERARVALQQEFRFQRTLNHEGFTKALQLDPERGDWILYEDSQCTLEQLLLQEGAFPVDQVANVLEQLAEALVQLQAQKLGHGNLDSRAVLVGTNGAVKLAGFLGHPLEQAGEPLPLDPAARYRAPELLRQGLAACNETSDLYCLGFLAIELLTAQEFPAIFITDDRDREAGRVNWLGWHHDPRRTLPDLQTIVPKIVASLKNILTALIAKEPGQRGYRQASLLLKALREFGLGSRQRLPAYQSTPRRSSGRKSTLPSEATTKRPIPTATAPAGSLELLEIAWEFAGQSHTQQFFGRKPVLLGQAVGCGCRIDDPALSMKHALFTCQKDGWWIYDLGSSGLYQNRRRVLGMRLRRGLEFELGQTRMQIVQATIPASTTKPTTSNRRTRQATPGVSPPGYPRSFGRFELTQPIHQGQNGTLYRALWRRGDGVNRLVALRVYPPEFATNELALRRFLRGNPAAGQIRHPNIVRLIRGGSIRHADEQRSWYLAMEYLTGGSLRDRLRLGRLSVAEVIRLGRDIGTALFAAEEQKLLHRNVNPSCILFTQSGTAKLGDFALLREVELQSMHDITRAGGAPLGELLYQPPEIIEGDRYTILGDLYSLAACQYHALTGQPPIPLIEGDYPKQLSAILTTRVPLVTELRPGVPDGLASLIRECLARSTKDRPETIQQYLDRLSRIPH